MTEQLFRYVFSASCVGTTLGILLLAVQPFTKRKFSGRWHYFMWCAVMAAMLLPIPIRALPEQFLPPNPPAGVERVVPQAFSFPCEAEAGTEEREQSRPEGAGISLSVGVRNLIAHSADRLAWIWLAAAAALLLLKLMRYAMLRRRLCRRSAAADRAEFSELPAGSLTVRRSEQIRSPLLLGVWSPILFLPAVDLPPEQLRHILLHERIHLRRRDVWVKWFALAVKCIHWFNPAVWLIARKLDSECEISCDLEVTKGMNREEKRAYLNTLLALASGGDGRTTAFAVGIAKRMRALRTRFLMVKNAPSPGGGMSFFSLCVAAVIALCAFFGGGTAAYALAGKSPTDASRTEEGRNAEQPPDAPAILLAPAPEQAAEEPQQTELLPPTEPVKTAEAALEDSFPAPPEDTAALSAEEPEDSAALPLGEDGPEEETEEDWPGTFYSAETADSELPDSWLEGAGRRRTEQERLDLKEEYRVIPYQSDAQESYCVTVRPDQQGQIALWFHTEAASVPVNIQVYPSGKAGEGWGYRIAVDSHQTYRVCGLDAGREYCVEICGYIPGKYHISGDCWIY